MQIAKGAEAELTRDGNVLTKERIPKGYRLPEMDNRLRKRRTANEARLLMEARRAGVNAPQVLEEEGTTLRIEFIDGKKARDILDIDICEKIGEAVAKLHSYNIIHGDLTTSNMILCEGKLYLIDFGLGFVSQRPEDKAVDLYLLHEVLESTHFSILDEAWGAVLDSYKAHYEGAGEVIKALLNVEKRGRYKERTKS